MICSAYGLLIEKEIYLINGPEKKKKNKKKKKKMKKKSD